MLTKFLRAATQKLPSKIYVAAGNSGYIATSTNTVTWTTRTSGTTSNFNTLTYGNGVYVAGGDNRNLRTSTDGVTWTARTSGFPSSTDDITASTFGNNTYVIGGNDGLVRTSTDGITWTTRSMVTTNTITALSYQNNVFLAGFRTFSAIRTSTDAITWTLRTVTGLPADSDVLSFSYGNGIYVLGNNNTDIFTSTNLTSWTERNPPINPDLDQVRQILFNNGIFVLGGNGVTSIATTTDFVTYTARTFSPGTTRTIDSLIYADNQYVIGCDDGTIFTSTDTITWSLSADISNINSLVYG